MKILKEKRINILKTIVNNPLIVTSKIKLGDTTLFNIVDLFVKIGLIERKELDGKSKINVVTPKGQEVFKYLKMIQDRWK